MYSYIEKPISLYYLNRVGVFMEIRKVQMTGGSSFVISLPKSWINSLKIKKNDPIGVVIQPDNTLLITTKISGEQEISTKEFNVDEINNPEFLFRSLIGAYNAGFSIIKIKSKKMIQPFARSIVRKFTQNTIGQEVVEEADNYIIIKDLLNPLEMPFNSTIRRMYIISRSMHEEAIKTLQTREPVFAEDVIFRDNDVDRLHWLIARQSSILLKNINLAEKIDIKPYVVINYFLISRFIERIGDHAVYIIRNIQNLGNKKVDKSLVDLIVNADEFTLEIFDKSIESLFKKNMKMANESIEKLPRLIEMCKNINAQALSQKGAIAVYIGYIIESIRRTGVYSGDIAESIINYLISSN